MEAEPYTPSNPRRSRRARSLVDRYSPAAYPLLKVEKDLKNPKTGPRHSRSRSSDYETASKDRKAEASHQYFHLFNEEMRQGIGQIRIPLMTELLKMSDMMIEMRNLEIKFIASIIDYMKAQNVDEDLITLIENGLDELKCQMNPDVQEGDLPPVTSNNYVDVSVFLIIFFEKIHENMHRIIDLESCLNMLTQEQRRHLKSFGKEASKLFLVKWNKFVDDLEMPEFSKTKYQNVRDEILSNCESCSPK